MSEGLNFKYVDEALTETKDLDRTNKKTPRGAFLFVKNLADYSMNVSALPFLLPRAVRPMRWT